MKQLITSLLLISSFLPFMAQAQDSVAPLASASAEKYQEGKHYRRIPVPVHTANPEKIEVNEVFWYGCPHCYHFEAILEPWVKKLPDDVDFERTPAIYRPAMEVHARAYYVAKQLNMLDAMHTIIFKSMQEEKKALANENDIAALFAAHGVSDEAARKAYNSFSVQSQTRQADARVRGYGVEGTPEIIVNGKYRVSSSDTGSQEAMLSVASFLIEKERKEKGTSK
ncbi:MAG TPA: thiol:disulfide interchange protein DsbA/DsbL [Pseudomonadales bacterium]|nr:thiol:disulfide interchange protein DsbA/DsbL [Pseudomonadales bacterium]